MKKSILIAAALLVAGAVNAQVKIGATGGLDVSNIIKTNDNNFDTKYTTGFNAGITLEIPIVGPLGIEPEVLYAQKGYKANIPSGDFTQTRNFVDVPLLARIKLADGFAVLVGPQFSFATSTRNVYSNGISTTTQTQYNNDRDNLRKNIVGGVAGFSIDLSKSVDFRARYALDLQKNNGDGTSQTPEYRNQVFQFGLAFKVY
ncbi:outer membrane protein with beta-barrel domain [Mucilaginibacter gracilis]|uniref:Outer membrane protein with beta-barrel domain n=1 Tax=Mucilaginibacter gracilis TaxID=423350 RepID=A0A495IY10_9SPHI|nr:porin family protein [Mucilaginibacter gracilis]RKR81586.1 outer membrane protein with beta-barrel domain [Mucilaginibacter gracilis]